MTAQPTRKYCLEEKRAHGGVLGEQASNEGTERGTDQNLGSAVSGAEPRINPSRLTPV
jgi:hypothetical protein